MGGQNVQTDYGWIIQISLSCRSTVFHVLGDSWSCNYSMMWVNVKDVLGAVHQQQKLFYTLSFSFGIPYLDKNVMNGLKAAAESCAFPPEPFVLSDFYCEVRGSGRQPCYSLSSQQRALLLNTEQLVCPQQCNRIWERAAGHYHHHSVWPTKSAKALSPTAVSAKQLLKVHSKLL